MNDQVQQLSEQIQHTYTEHYLPWCIKNHVMQPKTFPEYQTELINHCLTHITASAEALDNSDSNVVIIPMPSIQVLPMNKPASKPVLKQSFFIADRVSKKTNNNPAFVGGPHNHQESTVRQCVQCSCNVWVSKNAIKEAEESEGIICTECVPEMIGITPEQFRRDLNNGLNQNG